MFFIGLYLCLKFLALRILEVASYLFCVLKIHDEILSRRNSEKLSEIFFDEVYPLKFYLTKFFVSNVLNFEAKKRTVHFAEHSDDRYKLFWKPVFGYFQLSSLYI